MSNTPAVNPFFQHALTNLACLTLVSPSAYARSIRLTIVDIVTSRLIPKVLGIECALSIARHVFSRRAVFAQLGWIETADICAFDRNTGKSAISAFEPPLTIARFRRKPPALNRTQEKRKRKKIKHEHEHEHEHEHKHQHVQSGAFCYCVGVIQARSDVYNGPILLREFRD
jgi:hypothetical protein